MAREGRSRLTAIAVAAAASNSNIPLDTFMSGVPEPAAAGGERERYRTTSGSEAGLELDTGGAKVVEVYGFVGWITTLCAWVGYLLYAYLPESVLRRLGVTYYPDRYWAVAGPALLLMVVCFYTTIYGAIGIASNPHIDSFDAICDGYSKPVALPAGGLTHTLVDRLRAHRAARLARLAAGASGGGGGGAPPAALAAVAPARLPPLAAGGGGGGGGGERGRSHRGTSAPPQLRSPTTTPADASREASDSSGGVVPPLPPARVGGSGLPPRRPRAGSTDVLAAESSGGAAGRQRRRLVGGRLGGGGVVDSLAPSWLRRGRRGVTSGVGSGSGSGSGSGNSGGAADGRDSTTLGATLAWVLGADAGLYDPHSTPDPYDLPITVVNKLQFFVAPRMGTWY